MAREILKLVAPTRPDPNRGVTFRTPDPTRGSGHGPRKNPKIILVLLK